jgi:hypothetical protein
MIFMAFKCKECGLKFEEKRRLDIHKQVHGRKPKISEYDSPEFNQDRLKVFFAIEESNTDSTSSGTLKG